MCGVGALVIHLPWCGIFYLREGGIFLPFKYVTFEEKVSFTQQCLKLQALREVLSISSSIEEVL